MTVAEIVAECKELRDRLTILIGEAEDHDLTPDHLHKADDELYAFIKQEHDQ